MSRFLSNITIHDAYTFPSADGDAGQVITTDGNGNLSFADATAQSALTLNVTVKNKSGGSLSKGTIVHASPSANPPSGNVVEVIAADYDTSANMPAIGVLNETLANEAEGQAIMFGAVSGIDTSSFSAGDELWVGNNGAFTNTKPATAGQLIQKIAVVIKSHASNGLIKIFGAGRTNDVPLPLYIDNTNQRVGVSVSNPSYKLDVNGGASSFRTQLGSGSFYSNDYTMDLSIYSTGGWARGFRVYNTNDNTYSLGFGKTGDYAYFVVDDPDVVDTTLYNSTKGLRVYNSGNVYVGQSLGVGTISPTSGYGIDVVGSGIRSIRSTGGWAGWFENTGSSSGIVITAGVDSGDAPLLVRTQNGTEIFSVRGDGRSWFTGTNVGIGTSSPTQKLHVVGNIYSTGQISTSGGSSNDVLSQYVTIQDLTSTNDYVLRFRNSSGSQTGYIGKISTFAGFTYQNSNGHKFNNPTTIASTLTLTSALKGPSTFYIDPSPDDTGEPGGATTDTGTVVILGDLQVTGTTTTIDSTTLNVGDLNIVLAKDATTAAAANGGGITINGANATMTYNSTDDRFEFNKAVRSSSHVLAGSNVYSGDASSFRNYGGVWKATTGVSGNGFGFISADGTAMTISSTGFVDINNGLLVNGGGSNFDTIRIEAPNASVYFKDTTSGVGAWHIGHNDSFLYVLEDTDGNGVYNNINARWDTGGYEQYTGNIDNRVGSYQIAGVNVIDSSRNISASGATFDSNVNIVKNNVGIITTYSSASIEATDAQLDIISSASGTWGSSINLVEGASSTANTNVWSIARQTSGVGNLLRFNFGTANQHDNAEMFSISTGGNATAQGSVSATVFYDVTNTAYYVNPDNTGTSANFAGKVQASQVGVTNIVTNKVVKFNGSILDDSIITDDGTFIDVAGKVQADNAFVVQGIDTSNSQPSADHAFFSGYGIVGNRGTFYITNAGTVQIGNGVNHNNNPTALFTSSSISLLRPTAVDGNLEAKDYIKITNTGGAQRLLLGNQDSSGVNNPAIIMAANGNTYIGGGSTWSGNGGTVDYTAIFTNGGDVGIGTISPLTKFHVYGDAVDNQSLGLFTNTYSSGGVFFPALKAVHTHSNHSYGIVAEFRTEAGAGTDRSAILFTNAHSASNWAVGQGVVGAVDDFAVGYRNAHPNTAPGWATGYFRISTAGDVSISNNIKSPIFYDSNDTGYFLDPATAGNGTVLNGVKINYLGVNASANTSGNYRINIGGSIHMNANNIDYINQLHFNDNVRFYDDGNDSYLNFKFGDASVGGIKFLNGSNAQQGFLYASASGFGLLSADGTWAVQTINNATTIHHSARSPIFYDSDNTAYYVDPASTSTSANFAGSITHKGLAPSNGTNIDQIYEVSMSFTLTADTWTDTGINSTDLATGTYVVQVFVSDHNAGGGHYSEYYSGTMSWYAANTNSTNVDEIVLHNAGHASNASHLQLRTQRHGSGGDDLMLQVKQNFTHSTALDGTSGKQMVFKFRRLI